MKILFFGDVVGKISRLALARILPQLKKEYPADIVLANVENLAHGKGVTAKTLKELKDIGINGFTSGNHVWKKEKALEAAEQSNTILITPANDPRTPKGSGYKMVEIGSNKLFVINLLGRVFIKEEDLNCPFKEVERILASDLSQKASAILVDIHAEATSEKMAMGWFLDGRVSAIIGTHTHIPTADYRLLPQGSAYVTDVGMVGPVDSVLGVNKETIIKKFLTEAPIIFDIPQQGEVEVNAVYLEVDEKSKLATKIEKINKRVII
ncbi:TIGR00282 family metallophosphoesterase [Patescibacteria group bacterium]|nr:TIGR00282 family metallophosphoesterase [Patescibacteria group bacterium]